MAPGASLGNSARHNPRLDPNLAPEVAPTKNNDGERMTAFGRITHPRA
jgi:hypothetical protein